MVSRLAKQPASRLLLLYHYHSISQSIPGKVRMNIINKGGVEDTRLEVKATKKTQGQGQGQPFRDRHSRGHGQECSRPKPRTKRKCSPKKKKKKKGLHKSFFWQSPKKRSSQTFFQAISTKKRFPENFSGAPQNFNKSKNSAVLGPRTG